MADIEPRRDPAASPDQTVQPAPAERFVRAVEQIAIHAAPRRQDEPRPAHAHSPTSASPTIIYITPAAPTSGNVAPTHVHHHTTLRQVAPGSLSRSSRKATSALGVAAVMFGIVSCVACWLSVAERAAFPVGVLGVALGMSGGIFAVLFGRTGTALPFAGAFISAIGVAISVVGTDATKPVLDNLQSQTRRIIDEGKKLLPADGKNASRKNPDVSDETISSPRTRQEQGAAPAAASNDAHNPREAPRPQSEMLAAARASAQIQLTAAVAAVDVKLARDDAYQTAKLIAEQSEAEVMRLRGAGQAGSPEMSIAANRALDARTRFKKLRDAALDSDSAVVSARKALSTAVKSAP